MLDRVDLFDKHCFLVTLQELRMVVMLMLIELLLAAWMVGGGNRWAAWLTTYLTTLF